MSLLHHPAVAGILVLLLSIYLYKFFIVPVFLSPLAKIPNAHPLSPVTSAWILYIRFTDQENKTLHELHLKKGPILRLGPNELSVNCLEGLSKIYAGGFEKHAFYDRLFKNYGIPSMFSTLRSKPHSLRKRLLAHIYSKSYIQNAPSIVDNLKNIIYERFLPIIYNVSMSSVSIEVLELCFAYSMDNFTAFQFGIQVSTNFLQNEEERKWWLHLFHCRKPFQIWAQEVPWLSPFLQKFGINIIPKFVGRATDALEEFGLRLCDEAASLQDCSKDEAHSSTVFQHFLAGLSQKSAASFSKDAESCVNRLVVASEMLDQNQAAQETSGITLTYILYHLSCNPSLQTRLRSELLSIDLPIVYPPFTESVSLPSPSIIDNLPLLDAVVMETLRLNAPIPGIQPRITPVGSTTLCEYSIPPDVRVQSLGYVLHRNASVFPEPETWKPERWLNSSSDELAVMRRWFWAFGSGGRMCIGKNFALNSIKYAVAAIYTNFTTVIVDDDGIEQADGYTVGPKGWKLILRFDHIDT